MGCWEDEGEWTQVHYERSHDHPCQRSPPQQGDWGRGQAWEKERALSAFNQMWVSYYFPNLTKLTDLPGFNVFSQILKFSFL